MGSNNPRLENGIRWTECIVNAECEYNVQKFLKSVKYHPNKILSWATGSLILRYLRKEEKYHGIN